MTNNSEKQEIFGCVCEETISPHCMEAFAIANGEIITTHISSSEAFAKADLGFGHARVSEHHSDRRSEFYKKLFPRGYELKWIGVQNHDQISKLLGYTGGSND